MTASFLRAALTLLPHSWRGPARRPDRAPLTWRATAFLYTFFAEVIVMAYVEAEPLPWRWHNGWVFAVQLVLYGASAVT